MRTYLLISAICFSAASCTWVKLTEAGGTVAVKSPAEITDCELIGRTMSMSRAEIAGLDRNREKLATELETIARNEAARMAANAVAPLSEIEGNEQRFGAYTCPD